MMRSKSGNKIQCFLEKWAKGNNRNERHHHHMVLNIQLCVRRIFFAWALSILLLIHQKEVVLWKREKKRDIKRERGLGKYVTNWNQSNRLYIVCVMKYYLKKKDYIVFSKTCRATTDINSTDFLFVYLSTFFFVIVFNIQQKDIQDSDEHETSIYWNKSKPIEKFSRSDGEVICLRLHLIWFQFDVKFLMNEENSRNEHNMKYIIKK